MVGLESNFRPRDRGSLGIGTLIVFVVVVIVAVIAAGVLVYTATALEETVADLLAIAFVTGVP